MRNGIIFYPEFEVIIRRFGLNITEHKMAELISGTKLMQAEQSLGFTKLNFSYTEESEFEKIILYIEDTTSSMARSSLSLSAANLINYSLLTFAIYLFSILIVSNLATYFFQGEYLGSFLCASVPLCFILYFSRRKSAKKIPEERQKDELNKSFEIITTSKAELVV
jgi:hypothetical protein